AQTKIQALVEQANEHLSSTMGLGVGSTEAKQKIPTLGIDDYQRHIFSSDVLYTLHMQDEKGQPGDISLADPIQHGPFSLSALRDGHFMPVLIYSKAKLIATPATQVWVDSQQGESPLLITTRVGVGGAGHSNWNFLPAE